MKSSHSYLIQEVGTMGTQQRWSQRMASLMKHSDSSNTQGMKPFMGILYFEGCCVMCRDACLINEGDSFLLTGGYGVYNTVSRYSMKGWIGDLKGLIQGRIFHGCTQFGGSMDRKVKQSLWWNVISLK